MDSGTLTSTIRAVVVAVGGVITLVALVALVAFLLPKPSAILTEPVTIGMTADAPGCCYRDPLSGQRSGFDHTLVQWLGRNADPEFTPGIQDVIVPTREEQLVRGGNSGGVDLVVSSYTISSDREKLVDFAGPYLQNFQSAMVRSDEPVRLARATDLAGRAACAQTGSTSIAELRRIPGVVVVERPTLLGCVTALRDREVDAVSTDELLLLGYARTDPGLRVESQVQFGAVQQYGIGLPPTDGTEDCELLNGLVEQFVNSEDWHTAFINNYGDGLDRNRFRPNPRSCVADSEPGGA